MGKSRHSRQEPPLPEFVPPQLSQPVEKPPSGPQWLHEIKLDGYRVAMRIDKRRVQLLTRTGLDWSDQYPSVVAALANLKAKTAYIDGELARPPILGGDSLRRREAPEHHFSFAELGDGV
jgi:ATP-dependent DNA ligase